MWTPVPLLLVLKIATLTVTGANEDSDRVTKKPQEFVPSFVGTSEIADPLFIEHIDLSIPTLKFKLQNLFVSGLRDAVLKEIRFDESKTSIYLKFQSTIGLEGLYDITGELVTHIEGSGPIHILLRNIEMIVNAAAEKKVGFDGKLYWHFQYKNHTFVLKDVADLEFENLVNGNYKNAIATKNILGKSGNEIMNELGDPLVKNLIKIILVHINKKCDKIPIEELILFSPAANLNQ